MERQILETINKYNMLDVDDDVVVGFSGGADSVALLHFLHNHMKMHITCVHINHGLRDTEAEEDATFCEQFCYKLGVDFMLFNEDVTKYAKSSDKSVEEAGRDLRYARFYEVLGNLAYDKIAVAHNKNDVAETILMQIFRGSGGIKGIPPVAKRVVRPLINVGRDEIELYCKKNKLEFRVDSTNAHNEYTRNKVRNVLLPMIKQEFNPSVVDALVRLAAINADEDKILCNIAETAYKKCVYDNKIDIALLETYGTAIKRRVVRMALSNILGGLSDITFTHIDDVAALSGQSSGKQVSLPGGFAASRVYQSICIEKPSKDAEFSVILSKNQPTFVKYVNKWLYLGENIIKENAFTMTLDYGKIIGAGDEVAVRTRLPGDTIFFKTVGTKKIKDFFIDKKIPRVKRDAVVFVAKGRDVIFILDEDSGIKSNKFEPAGNCGVLYLQIWEDSCTDETI